MAIRRILILVARYLMDDGQLPLKNIHFARAMPLISTTEDIHAVRPPLVLSASRLETISYSLLTNGLL
jgi:hypothetical protein